MRNRLTVIAVFTGLLVTGCAQSEDLTKNKSNELMTIMWQACLNHYIELNKDDFSYRITGGSKQITLDAAKACVDLKPTTELDLKPTTE